MEEDNRTQSDSPESASPTENKKKEVNPPESDETEKTDLTSLITAPLATAATHGQPLIDSQAVDTLPSAALDPVETPEAPDKQKTTDKQPDPKNNDRSKPFGSPNNDKSHSSSERSSKLPINSAEKPPPPVIQIDASPLSFLPDAPQTAAAPTPIDTQPPPPTYKSPILSADSHNEADLRWWFFGVRYHVQQVFSVLVLVDFVVSLVFCVVTLAVAMSPALLLWPCIMPGVTGVIGVGVALLTWWLAVDKMRHTMTAVYVIFCAARFFVFIVTPPVSVVSMILPLSLPLLLLLAPLAFAQLWCCAVGAIYYAYLYSKKAAEKPNEALLPGIITCLTTGTRYVRKKDDVESNVSTAIEFYPHPPHHLTAFVPLIEAVLLLTKKMCLCFCREPTNEVKEARIQKSTQKAANYQPPSFKTIFQRKKKPEQNHEYSN